LALILNYFRWSYVSLAVYNCAFFFRILLKEVKW